VILDSSALLAVLFAEDDAATYAAAIEKADRCRMSAATWLESAIRVDTSGNAIASLAFDDFIREAKVCVEPVDEEQTRLARVAYRAYGRGSGHPASLNFGDCFSYALAKIRDEPLLFKGQDFGHTDLRSALLSSSSEV
jgi:ribonuclease VapC